MTARQPADPDTVSGTVERVTFHNEENGFCVLRTRLRGHRAAVPVVGHVASVSAGEWITASGEWTVDPSHGRQFRAKFLRCSPPTSAEGIERYLASGLIRGIGKVYASKLTAAFGESALDVIEREPERLREIPGIGPSRAAWITEAWEQQKTVREIMLFLHEHGVTTARAVRIHRLYGNDAIEVMSENPYRLARDIRGIGFRTADQIASRMGVAPDAPVRLRAGVAFVLNEATGDGHCAQPVETAIRTGAELLGADPAQVERALQDEVNEGTLTLSPVHRRECVFLTWLYLAEREVAERITALGEGRPSWPTINAKVAIDWFEERSGMALEDAQREAVRQALSSKTMVITGGPGVGKTTVVNAILKILQAKRTRIMLCAPTGRAARRMTEATGMEAKTIHRLLEFDPSRGRFKRDRDHPLDCDLLVVDETSMVDVPLMQALLRSLRGHCALLVVGDADQLPSVGPGQVLGDLIRSGKTRVVRLTEVFRQAAESDIITSAHRINRGMPPKLDRPKEGEQTDFYFVPAETAEDAGAKVVELVCERIPRRFGLDTTRDIQVLCPMNRGGAGATALNVMLQERLMPENARRITRFGLTFAEGDKVMQTENDYQKEVYNGDFGMVMSVLENEGEILVEYDGRPVVYGRSELDVITPAYAVTIHKSQGSEFPAVVIPVLMNHFLRRNLIYTGVTRGRQLVVLVGQRNAIGFAAQKAGGHRCTKLREWLEGRG